MRSKTANWFICKIRYWEDGLQKKVTETYVVDAVSFTEAEARIIEEMSAYISGEFEVIEIDRAVFKEIFFKEWDNQSLEDKMQNTDTRWYKSKLQFITIDEKTEKEKRSNVYYLVEGCSLESARRNIDEVMGGTMIDYSIASVSETPIMDVFEYKVKSDK